MTTYPVTVKAVGRITSAWVTLYRKDTKTMLPRLAWDAGTRST
jgi:hypothetical protein